MRGDYKSAPLTTQPGIMEHHFSGGGGRGGGNEVEKGRRRGLQSKNKNKPKQIESKMGILPLTGQTL